MWCINSKEVSGRWLYREFCSSKKVKEQYNSLAQQPGPTAWPNNLAQQPGPTAWPNNLAQQPGLTNKSVLCCLYLLVVAMGTVNNGNKIRYARKCQLRWLLMITNCKDSIQAGKLLAIPPCVYPCRPQPVP